MNTPAVAEYLRRAGHTVSTDQGSIQYQLRTDPKAVDIVVRTYGIVEYTETLEFPRTLVLRTEFGDIKVYEDELRFPPEGS